MTNDIYGIEKWGKGFFKILENGSLGLLNPLKKQSKPIDLTKIVTMNLYKTKTEK